MTNKKFDISISGSTATIDRIFEFEDCQIDLRVRVLIPDSQPYPTLLELHQKSIDIAIANLQSLKPPPQA